MALSFRPLEIAERHVIDVVEAAYGSNADLNQWLASTAHALQRAIPSAISIGGVSYQWKYDPRGDFRIVDFGVPVIFGEDMQWTDSMRAGILALPPPIAEQIHGRMQANVLTRASEMGEAVLEHPVLEGALSGRLKDQLGIVGPGDGHGFILAGSLVESTRIPSRMQRVLDRMTFHLAAGHRMRSHAIDAAEAVLSASGKVLHAEGVAKTKRDALDDGFRRRAHARKNAAHAETALDVWRALTAGRWSIVDHWDTDGKRFVLAVRNPPRARPLEGLSPRERRVAALAAAGHRDKEIAYVLGLTLPAVATAVLRARRKLGAKTRTDLATAWRTRAWRVT